jgi:hypothetical protein
MVYKRLARLYNAETWFGFTATQCLYINSAPASSSWICISMRPKL